MTPSTATTEELIRQIDNPRFWGMGQLDPVWYNRKRELVDHRIGVGIVFFKLTANGIDYVIDHLGRRHTGENPGDALLNCVLTLKREAGMADMNPGDGGLRTAYQGASLGVVRYGGSTTKPKSHIDRSERYDIARI